MSEETISRWNAIPLVRKRSRSSSRSDKEDDPGDDLSLVSRTPSPVPKDADETREYDAFHKGSEREVITIHTKIGSSNIGHKLLSKMGWREGEGLGLSGQGRAEPIPIVLKSDSMGLGKSAQDLRILAVTATQRRDMDAERQSKETIQQRQQRENSVAKAAAIKSEIVTALRPFYCELCDKQYMTVAQYDEHIRSYAHTHKQRFREMEAARKPKDNSKAREKERKREEKELKKLAAASGVKLAAAAKLAVPPIISAPPSSDVASGEASSGVGNWSTFKKNQSGGFKPSGWATVSGTPLGTTESDGATGGWARVSGSISSSTVQLAPAIAPESMTVQSSAPGTSELHGNTVFQSSGFTQLDTTSDVSPSFAPPPPPREQPPPPPEPSRSGGPGAGAPPSLPSVPKVSSQRTTAQHEIGLHKPGTSLPSFPSRVPLVSGVPRPPSPPRHSPYNAPNLDHRSSPEDYPGSPSSRFHDYPFGSRDEHRGPGHRSQESSRDIDYGHDYNRDDLRNGYGLGHEHRPDVHGRDDYGRKRNFDKGDYGTVGDNRSQLYRGRGPFGRR